MTQLFEQKTALHHNRGDLVNGMYGLPVLPHTTNRNHEAIFHQNFESAHLIVMVSRQFLERIC